MSADTWTGVALYIRNLLINSLKLLYIKPGFHGDEDAGITAYALANASFPHESTLNQWFNEAQFESYRSLGRHIFNDYCRRGGRPIFISIGHAGAARPDAAA